MKLAVLIDYFFTFSGFFFPKGWVMSAFLLF